MGLFFHALQLISNHVSFISGGDTLRNDTSVLTESTYYVLLSLTTPKHGYAMMQQIEQLTDGRVRMGPGTMYGVLKNLLEKGWIKIVEEAGRQKIYGLTTNGYEVCLAERARLSQVLQHADDLLKGATDEKIQTLPK